MSVAPPEVALVMDALTVLLFAIAALLYAIRRISAFDLELRANRERRREEYVEARRRALRADNEYLQARRRRQPPGDWTAKLWDPESDAVDPSVGSAPGAERARVDEAFKLYDLPPWALVLLDPAEAERCSREWKVHLIGRLEHGELHAARADRRSFARYALLLAMTRRIRRARCARSR
jgi:hypothetical protein